MSTITPGELYGRFQRFGASATGSVAKTTLLSGTIAAVSSNAGPTNQGNTGYVDKFKVTVGKSGSNSLFQLELSTDGTSFTEVARIEVPDYGIVSDPDLGLFIPAGYTYRVSVTQSTAARCSASLIGRAAQADIVDI
jgi:hypothetical protein